MQWVTQRRFGALTRLLPLVADAPALINYDFVPGDKVLFAEDFSGDKVGDTPQRLKLQSGNFEIADFKGQRFLRTTSGGRFMIPLRAPLPQKFTLEFDVIHSWAWATDVHFVDHENEEGRNSATFGTTSPTGACTSSPAADRSAQRYP